MASEQPPSVQVAFTPEFKRNLRQLAKKYRHIKSDIQPLIDQLERGETPGDRIPRVAYGVFKVRIRNSDVAKGKSGGYRVIYYQIHEQYVTLVTLYSKTEQGDVATDELRRIIGEYEAKAEDEQ